MAPVNKDEPVLILGAGTFGLSTALHLSRAGHTNITLLDSSASLPSANSAGNDLNKIVRAEYEQPFYVEAALEAIEHGWKTPLFAPFYHQTGYLMVCSGNAPQKAVDAMDRARASVDSHPAFKNGIQTATSRQDLQSLAWQLDGPLDGFRGYFNPLAGYAHSGNAQKSLAEYLAKHGVRFILGDGQGSVSKLIYDGQGKSRRCVGAQTKDGKTHRATRTVCALGANSAALIPEIAKFTIARCWPVAHIQLTERECDVLRGIPVVNVRDLGFFFEPDPATRLLKLCPLGAGYTDTRSSGTSLPSDEPVLDFIPATDEAKLRRLLKEALPSLADRPFVDKKMCWFSDSRDSEYCIDFVPNTNNSLVALAGDSGHGFKMLPIFGKWVVELLNRGRQDREVWRWRSDASNADWGSGVSWRIGEAKELRDVLAEEGGLPIKAKL